MLIYQATKQTLLKLDSRSKLYERYKLKRSDKHQMSKPLLLSSFSQVVIVTKKGMAMTTPELQNQCHNFESRLRIRGRGVSIERELLYIMIIPSSEI